MKDRVVNISQQTNYPWDGEVNINIDPGKSGKFSVLVRIPGWAQDQPVPSDLYRYMNKNDEKVILKVNGNPVKLILEKGYVRLERNWTKDDKITIDLPMPVRRVLSHEKVEDNSGRVALERGPVVYCAEWVDNDGKALDLVLNDNAVLQTEYQKDMLNGVTVIKSKSAEGHQITAIPYYSWAHRGRGEMNVWLKRQ